MAHTVETCDVHLPSWNEYQNTPRGRLRRTVAQANLTRHLTDGPLHILDAGGGSGEDALHFARQGHAVALLDFSADMLTQARNTAQEHGVAQQITFHHADVAHIPSLFPAPIFDLVLCHAVVPYVDDIVALMQAVCSPLKPEGLLSVIGINRYSEAYREALMRLDPDMAMAKLDTTTTYSTMFDMTLQMSAAEDVTGPLESLGCTVLGQYGVRCVCDYLPDNDLKQDPEFFSRLEKLEIAMSGKYPYYLLARFFQIVARKTTRENSQV